MNLIKLTIYYIVVFCIAINAQEPKDKENSECFPPCRSGYICHKGKCIEKCNPPCPSGTKCTKDGECEPAEKDKQNIITKNRPIVLKKMSIK